MSWRRPIASISAQIFIRRLRFAHPQGLAIPICPWFSVSTPPTPVLSWRPACRLQMAIWRAMVWLPGETEALPPTRWKLLSEFPPSHQSHHSCTTCSLCPLKAMPAPGPWVPSPVVSLGLVSCLLSPREKGPKLQPRKGVPTMGCQWGHFRMFVLDPSRSSFPPFL